MTVDLRTTGIDVPEIDKLAVLRRVRSRILDEQMMGDRTALVLTDRALAGAVHLEQGEKRARGAYAMLAWWTGPTELQFVELTSAGPALPIETLRGAGGAIRSPALVSEARRIVAGR